MPASRVLRHQFTAQQLLYAFEMLLAPSDPAQVVHNLRRNQPF